MELTTIEDWVWFLYDTCKFSIIPIKRTDPPSAENKKPNIPTWEKYKNTRPTRKEISTWLGQGKFKNIAVIGGKVSGNLICFDVDDPQAFIDLNLNVDKLMEQGAWVVETPKEKGRYHIIVRDKNDIDVTRNVKQDIDMRANGHYWVVYPSIHPNGKQYNLLNSHDPGKLKLPLKIDTQKMWNDWVETLYTKRGVKETLRDTVKKKKEYDDSPDCIRNAWELGATPGGRYYTAVGLGSWLQQQKFPSEMAKKIVTEWFKTKCDGKGRPIKDIENGASVGYKGEYQTGCTYWRENTDFCPYTDKTECPFYEPENKKKSDLLEEYEVFETKENKKTGELIKTGKINCPRLAELIMKEHNHHFITMRDNEEIYYFINGYYHDGGETEVKRLAEYYLDDVCCSHLKNEVVSHIQDKNYADRVTFQPAIHLLNFRNGIFNLRTKKLEPHNPKYRFINMINVDYDLDAKYDEFEKFLNQICSINHEHLRGSVVDTIQEYMGYSLYRAYDYKKYVVLDGGGDNGKTTLLDIILALIGPENNTSIALQELNERPFAKSQLYGKHTNIADDLPKRALKYTGDIKKITGNSPIWADIKNHKKGIEFINYAKPYYACNELPETNDYTDAFFSRMIQITLINKYLPEGSPEIDNKSVFKSDTTIIKRLTIPKKLSGILNFALEGLYRLLENNHFTDGKSIEQKREEWMRKTNPIHAFITDEIEMPGTDWGITVDDFYSEILSYCERSGFDKPTKHKVTKKVFEEHVGIRKMQKNIEGQPRVWCWLGVRSLTESTINHFFGENVDEKTTEEQQKKL